MDNSILENDTILEVENLYKEFSIGKESAVNAVNGVNFTIAKGETLGLVGESGCGKSTVGRSLLYLTEPTNGKVVFKGTELSSNNIKDFRHDIQMVFQDPYGSLNPRKKVRQIIEENLKIQRNLSKEEMLNIVNQTLTMVELDSGYLDKYPVELTQGEQQRIGIARAFVTDPQLIVLDEPTSLLDLRYRGEVVNLLKKIQKEKGTSYLFISHDLDVVLQISHKIAVMYLGRIIEEGPADKVFNSPKHPYTKALLAAALHPDPNQKREDFALKGEVPSPVNLANDRCNFAPRCPEKEDHCYKMLPELKDIDDKHHVACFKYL